MRSWGKAIALGVGLGWAVTTLIFYTQTRGDPVDAWCYYGMDSGRPYDPSGCFLYSPPIALVMSVAQDLIQFEAFYTALRVVEMVVLAVLTGPAIGLALLIPAVAIEINAANVNILLVGAVVVGFRYPWTWAFVILTKVTPGIGLLWFAVRREWRSFWTALGLTVAIASVSFLLAPWLWGDYLVGLVSEPDESPFKIWWRLPIAAAVVIWGARANHRWALIVAVFLAMPRWYFLSPVILVGLFPLVRLTRPFAMPRWLAAKERQPAAATSDGRTAAAPSS